MDFDTAKENIQPLRHGRRADRLEAVVGHETNKEQIELEKQQYEESISKYEGNDPLSPWYDYICWIEQSFPNTGTESGLDEVVLKCIMKFESDTRYQQDRRMIKLYIKYIDTRDDPQESYTQLYNNGIGTLVADLYIAWSYYYDAMNDYKKVEAIFRKGFDAGAQPVDDLKQAHTAFSISMSQRLLYDDDTSKKQFQEKMEEKRSALTSLRAHKNKFVGSLRTGIAIRDENPGVVNQENFPSQGNAKPLDIHEDDSQGAAALPANVSVIRSIIDSTRKKENVHEPGPWTKAKSGKVGGLFGKAAASSQPSFDIMEDEGLTPIPCPENLFAKGINLPSNWKSRNNMPQKSCDYPIFIEEPIPACAIPQYDKFLLYPNEKTEISPEEYRAYKWFKDRGVNSKLAEQYESVWTNKLETGIRIPPGFVSKNVKQSVSKIELFIASEEDSMFQVPLKLMYPSDGEVFSFEEIRAEKFKRGEIQVLTENDFEEVNDDNMEITVIGDRRQSIYPASRKSIVPRKSIAPRKSVMPPPSPVKEESEEEIAVAPHLGAVRKRKSDEKVDASQNKREFVKETPPRSSFGSENVFKPPAPPMERKSIRPFAFELPEDDETCSTQQFNFFLKSGQLASTPMSKKSSARFDTEVPAPPAVEPTETSPTNISQGAIPKQLSTIMETTETTHSTKSSVSGQNDTDFNAKKTLSETPMGSPEQHEIQKEIEKRFDVMGDFRIPEDQTETCAKITLKKLPQIHEINNITQPKLMMSMKEIEFKEPTFEDPDAGNETKIEKIVSPVSIKNSDESQMFVPESPEDVSANDDIEIPATQEVDGEEEFDIPATQEVCADEFEIPATQNFDVPATQETSAIFVPATQDFEIFEDIPATQDVESHEELKKPDETAQNTSIPFNIYEDSVMEAPRACRPQAIQDDEGTGFLHMSRKENLIVHPPISVKSRRASEEFLDFIRETSPTAKKVVGTSKAEENVSDLLKFSLEGSLKRLSIEPPKSATPTNLFDDDLNTEKFSLGNLKNSTLLVDNKKAGGMIVNDFNLSIAMDEDEMERLGIISKVQEPQKESEFKVPAPPVFKAPSVVKPLPKAPSIGDENSDDDFVDMSKSIYTDKLPEDLDENEGQEGQWEEDYRASFVPTAFNRYEHTMIDDEIELSQIVEHAIEKAQGNPFDPEVHEAILEHCRFSQYLENHIASCALVGFVKKLRPKVVVETGKEEFTVLNCIGKGSFASVFSAKSSSGRIVAMKQEKPANLWEYYICAELHDRLKNRNMAAAFMNIESAVIGNDSSILTTAFSPYGTIINVCNKFKKVTNKNLDEYIVMMFTSQLLSIIDHLHGCKIIHGDIKPDNFLLMSKLQFGMKVPALQLIDFGAAIDMECYSTDAVFTYKVETENFICCEMQDNKPWTYQTDLFGIAGTSFVMLFGEYMTVKKKIGTWNVNKRFPRYFDKLLWEDYFTTLLNIQSCLIMPNLQALKNSFEEKIHEKERFVCEKINEFNNAIAQN